MVLDAGEAHLWYVLSDRVTDPVLFAELGATLSAEERARRDRFVFEKDQRQYQVARGLLRRLLGRYLGVDPRECAFVTNEHGKPSLAPGTDGLGLGFNVSHTTGLIAIAVAHTLEVGVDVEDITRTPVSPDLPRRFFSPTEVAALERLPLTEQKTTFFDYWTLKEAYIKARGLGLSLPLDGFSMHLDGPDQARITFAESIPDDAASWQFARFRPSERHRMALALRRSGQDVTVRLRELDAATL